MTTAAASQSLTTLSVRKSLRGLIARRETQLIITMILIVIVCAALNHQFLSSRVIANIFITAMVTVFLSLGQLLVMLTKGIDLSVAPVLGISALVVGFSAQNSGLGLGWGILLGAAVGAVLGIGNAVLVSLIGLPPIIATLGTFSVYGGLQFIVAHGTQVLNIPSQYTQFGIATNTLTYGIPPIVLAGIVVTVVIGLLLRQTTFGRNIYATGDDREAAFRAGIPTRRVVFIAYIICGVLAGIGGVIYLTRTGSADAITGSQTNEELNAIAAALIGGAALTGGRGTALGAVLGALFLALTLSAMGQVANIPSEWQPAGVGVLILLAVVADPRARQGGALKTIMANARRKLQR